MVYTLVNHPCLGFVLEPHVVQVNSLGNFTLTHQRIFSRTASYFSKKISPDDLELITLLDELDDDFLFRKFYTNPKKKIRTAEFFQKYCSDELFNEEIRPYIEQCLTRALNRLRGRVIYKMGNDNNPTSQKIEVSEEKASVLFHFRRDSEGTRYFPTIKYQGQRVDFMFKGASIISTAPAWMLLNNRLFDFAKDVDGKKLQPFLNKRFIQIAKSAEEAYFNKFVTHLVEKYDVYAEGFSIETRPVEGKAVLSVVPHDHEQIVLKLSFRYGQSSFDYGTRNHVSAIVSRQGDEYTFTRFRRKQQWEEERKQWIESLDLRWLQSAYFGLKHSPGQAPLNELIPLETTNKYEFLEWLSEHIDVLKAGNMEINQADEFNKYFIGNREIRFDVSEQKDWFDVKATVKFGQYEFSFLSLKEYILKGKREFILPNGLVAVIPPEWFGNLAGMLELSISNDEIRLEKYHVGLLEELHAGGGRFLRISDKLDRIKNYGQVKPRELPQAFEGVLRPYQKAGYDWFYFLKDNGFGGCLADDMGLGKTIQTLALLQNEKETYAELMPARAGAEPAGVPSHPQLDLFGPVPVSGAQPQAGSQAQALSAPAGSVRIKTSLIVVPNSLVYNWYNESRKFTPNMRVLVYTGINREKNPRLFQQYDLVITTYGTVRVDVDLLKEFRFNYIILDESQSIKNPQSLASRAVKQLRSENRLVLTGTPIENSVQELWSQLAFINPGLLGSLQSFTERFVTPIEKGKDVNRLKQLKAIIRPFVLRRTKDQVATELPAKIEQVVYCNMTEQQAEAYETVKSYYRNEILKSIRELGLGRSHFTILQGLTKLRQIANHPVMTNPDYTGQAGKFDELMARAETAGQEGHKVLVFSQFVKQLEIYRAQFDEKGWQYCYLDGSMSNEERQVQVQRFQSDPSVSYFLISLKAGGVGLNLTAADYVFIIDPWWNPAVEQQAVDRTHRIGQTKTVFTYKFITKDTVEEKILALQQRKKELAGSIITTEESFIKTIDVDEIVELLS